MYYRLKTFIKIAEVGSITLAAKSLSLTQPAVTQHVRFLEQKYGVNLIHRKGSGIELTPEGEQLYNLAKDAVKKIDEIDQFFVDKEMQGKATLNFSMIDSVAFSIASPVMKKILMTNTSLLVHPSVYPSASVIGRLEGDEIDLGICVVDDIPKTMGSEVLFEEPLIFIGSERDKNIKSTDELRTKDFIVFPHHAKTRALIDEVLQRLSISPKKIVDVLKISTIVPMVEAGMGVSIVPCYAVYDDLKNKRVYKLPIETGSRRSIGIIYRKGAQFSKSVLKFVELLRAEAKKIKRFPKI